MASIEFDFLTEGAQYENFRFAVMKSAWGAKAQSYLDAGDTPYIGTGFDMRASFAEFDIIAQGVLGSAYTPTISNQLWTQAVDVSVSNDTDAKLRHRLDNVLEANNVDASFAFAGQGAMKGVLQTLGLTAESMMTAGDFEMPFSEERAAVFSLAFEGVDVSAILDDILIDSDRISAWLAIRYGSNDDPADNGREKREVAARRYIQSDQFELYNNPRNVGYDEARDVALAYQANRLDILRYEDKYDPDGNGHGANAAGGLLDGGINDQLQPAIGAIARNFGLTIGRIDEVLFANGRTPNLAGDGTGFDSKKNDDDLLIGDGRDNTIAGGQGNDVILGLGGNDDLTGGLGNDRLFGGIGRDLLKGALGNDRLNGGANRDRLVGGDGNDTYVLMTDTAPDIGGDPSLAGGGNSDLIVAAQKASNSDVVVEARNGGNDTVIVGVSGNFNIKNVEKFQLAGDISGNVAVTLNQFDSFRLSGGDDTLTLTINRLQKEAIDIFTGGGADTIRIKLAPGIDPSQVLDHKGLTARFHLQDLSAQDTIDLTSIGIKKIVMNDLDIHSDKGFYLMAPGAQVHLMQGDTEQKTYTNDTDSWFVVKCGDHTPYGPEFFGQVDKGNFDI